MKDFCAANGNYSKMKFQHENNSRRCFTKLHSLHRKRKFIKWKTIVLNWNYLEAISSNSVWKVFRSKFLLQLKIFHNFHLGENWGRETRRTFVSNEKQIKFHFYDKTNMSGRSLVMKILRFNCRRIFFSLTMNKESKILAFNWKFSFN